MSGLDDGELARLIRADRIDILVELAGFTKDSRLLACTARPAPIQISYLGYPNTTGLPQIDYRITDHLADPDDADDFHTETLIRLPRCFLAFAAPEHAPAVEAPPVLRHGHVTFGSFNNLAKVNGKVVALWAEVLRAVPARACCSRPRAPATRTLKPICAARSRPPEWRRIGSSSPPMPPPRAPISRPISGSTSPSTPFPTTAPRRRAKRCGWACPWSRSPATATPVGSVPACSAPPAFPRHR